MYGFIVDTSSTLPFMAFSQGDIYVFTYSFLFFSFAKAAVLALSAPVDTFSNQMLLKEGRLLPNMLNTLKQNSLAGAIYCNLN